MTDIPTATDLQEVLAFNQEFNGGGVLDPTVGDNFGCPISIGFLELITILKYRGDVRHTEILFILWN